MSSDRKTKSFNKRKTDYSDKKTDYENSDFVC